MGWLGRGSVLPVVVRARRRNEGGGEEQGREEGREFHAEGEGEAAHRGVDWLKAGDGRWRAWSEAEEEKKNRGSRAGNGKRKKKKEDREGGRGFTREPPLFPFFG